MFGMRLGRIHVLLFAVLAVLLTLAACTSTSDDDSSTDDGEAAAAEAVETSDDAASDDSEAASDDAVEESDDAAGDDGEAAEADQAEEELPDRLVFGRIPAEDADETLLLWEPVRAYIEETVGIEVEMQVATDYAGVIEAMNNGFVDFAGFGPFSYVLANNMGAAELLVAPQDPATGEHAVYYSAIITHVDSDIHSVEDLVGRDFGFVDPASTSGHLIPELGLIEAGFDPWEDFNSVFAGGHDVVAISVFNQSLDAGAVAGGPDFDEPLRSAARWQRMEEAGTIDVDDFRVIWVSEPIPGSPIAVHPDTPQVIKDLLQEAFINAYEQEELLEVMGNPWVTGDDSGYDIIRRAASELGIDIEDIAE